MKRGVVTTSSDRSARLWFEIPAVLVAAGFLQGIAFEFLIVSLPEGLPSPFDDYWFLSALAIGVTLGALLCRSHTKSGEALDTRPIWVWGLVALAFSGLSLMLSTPAGPLEWSTALHFPAAVLGVLVGLLFAARLGPAADAAPDAHQ